MNIVLGGQYPPRGTIFTGWQKTTFYTKRTSYYKGLFYVQKPLILRVHLMYQGSFLCTTYFHRTLYYKGPSYVLYIRWTLIKNYIPYTKGPSYVNSLEANQPGTDQATPMYIRWTLIKNYILYTKGPSYVLYIRWTLIKNYILYTKGPSYVNSLQANQTGTNQATPTYIKWTLIKVPALL